MWGTQRINPSSDLDEQSLANIAEKTGGQYFRARDSQSMSEIYGLLDKLEPIKQEQQQMRPLSAFVLLAASIGCSTCFGYLLSLHFSFLLPTKNVNTKKHADMNKDDINAMGGK